VVGKAFLVVRQGGCKNIFNGLFVKVMIRDLSVSDLEEDIEAGRD
jgi:hypothetical protein